MGAVGPFFEALAAGLSIWKSKEKTKYVDKLMKLREEYREAYNQTRRDHSVLDDLKAQLDNLAIAFATEVSKESGVKL